MHGFTLLILLMPFRLYSLLKLVSVLVLRVTLEHELLWRYKRLMESGSGGFLGYACIVEGFSEFYSISGWF